MSERKMVLAVIGDDDALVAKTSAKLRGDGHVVRGLTARLWKGEREQGIDGYVVCAHSKAEADAMTQRIEGAYAAREEQAPEIKVHVPKAKDDKPKTDGKEPTS